jgi:dipeptidyl aminopeptidase/acylaminoacyl peptidase
MVCRGIIAVVACALTASAATAAPARPFSACGEVPVAGGPAWASDGTLVYAAPFAPFELRSVRSDGTHERTLLRSETDVENPTLSPDGRLIAFDLPSADEVWIANRDGSDPHRIAAGRSAAFSPDGARLAVTGAEIEFNRFDLDVIDLADGGRRVVAADAGHAAEPTWSPDGRSIAFVGNQRLQLDFPALRVVGADGSGERFLGAHLGEQPHWSPDGAWIAYTDTADRALPTEIHLIHPDGSGDRPIVRLRGLDAWSPAWSPDGRRLAFTVLDAGTERDAGLLWVVDASGRGAHPIAADCRFGTGGAEVIRTRDRRAVYALEGADTVLARDGRRQSIHCGSGRDRVVADRRDRVAPDCERVRRR